MKNLNEQDFTEFINSDEKVVVSFSAEWCAPCKGMIPLLEKANEQSSNRIAKVDVDQNPNLAAKFGIRSIPTMLVFQQGMVMDKKVGAPKNTEEIVQLLN